MTFDETQKDKFNGSYPHSPVQLRHNIAGHPLLQLDSLVALARALPENQMEYNSGDLPVGQSPEATPKNGLSIEQTIQSIQDNGSWMVLKNVQTMPAYQALLANCIKDLSGVIQQKTGKTYRQEGFIFISSPGSVTPFHMDPEHNILLQISGEKTMHVFPADAQNIVSAEQHEAWHENGHRNLPWQDSFDALGTPYTLNPGESIHVPVKAPHWVQNGNDVSISFSITWRSGQSMAEADLHRMNALLRRNGFTPSSSTGKHRARDKAKALAFRALGKTRLIKH